MTTKVVVCINCPTSTDANGDTVWREWEHDDFAGIKQHQEEKPEHILIKGYKG